MKKKNSQPLYKKWWFWIILLAIITVIGFTILMVIAFNMLKPDENIADLEKELEQYNAKIYQTASKTGILIEYYGENAEDVSEKSTKIGEVIGRYLPKLSIYSEANFYAYSKEGEKEEFSIDTTTGEIKKEKSENWILEGSTMDTQIKQEIQELENKKTQTNTEIADLENKKNSLNVEIDKLNGDIVKAKGEPKTYPAGQLSVGTDISAGRYKIYGGNSNFIVRSATGDLEVNIILGTGTYDVNEYIYTFKVGDKVTANSSFKLVAIE